MSGAAGGFGQPAGDALTEAQSAALESKRRADRAYESVRELEKRHMIGIEYNHASRWWRLAKTSYFGFVVDGPEAESYREAERFKGEGEQARREGAGAEAVGRRMASDRAVHSATTEYANANDKYDQAQNQFLEARETLAEIEDRDKG